MARFGEIPPGGIAKDPNVKQGFQMVEEQLQRLNDADEETLESVTVLKNNISDKVAEAINQLTVNSTLANVISTLQDMSKKLKQL